jgi:acetyltransferase-like isoleucine patch superfamily enzyme
VIWKFYKRILLFFARHTPNNRLRILQLKLCKYNIGTKAYIAEDFIIIDELEKDGKIYIEDHATLAPRVTLITKSYPNASTITNLLPVSQGKVIIKRNAWIGAGVIIMPGVTVGEGAVVGAGCVITKSVPPYTIVIGVPGKVVRTYKKA